jgi:hypothetical protein
MFRYADRLGILLYVIGTICMAVSGTALPLLDLIFGQFVNTFNVRPEQKPIITLLTSFTRTLLRAISQSVIFALRSLRLGNCYSKENRDTQKLTVSVCTLST